VLTDDGLCSECNAPAKRICNGEVKVCSKCLAVLWHSGVVGDNFSDQLVNLRETELVGGNCRPRRTRGRCPPHLRRGG
jgi:hypothetical protein